MKKYLFILTFVLIIPLFNNFFPAYSISTYTNTSAKAMVVMEANDNRILYSKNENAKLPMASTTKIVTALTVLNNVKDLDTIVTIPKEPTLISGTSIYLKQGEKLSVRQLLYGLMLQSGNDAATALALHVGGSVENFCKMMKQTAIDCGAENSDFKNPHGLDADGHYTTASDLAKITIKALKNPEFKQIVSTKTYLIPEGENTTERRLVNKNRLLSSLEGCIGVKTGYTSKAGRCLVSAAERNDMQVVCVVFNCGPMFEESADLINKAFKEYSLVELLPDYNYVTQIAVKNGKKDNAKVYSKIGLKRVLTEDEKKSVKIVYDYPEILSAPLKKDQKIGEVKININNNLIFTENLYIIEEVKSTNLTDKINDIIENWK